MCCTCSPGGSHAGELLPSCCSHARSRTQHFEGPASGRALGAAAAGKMTRLRQWAWGQWAWGLEKHQGAGTHTPVTPSSVLSRAGTNKTPGELHTSMCLLALQARSCSPFLSPAPLRSFPALQSCTCSPMQQHMAVDGHKQWPLCCALCARGCLSCCKVIHSQDQGQQLKPKCCHLQVSDTKQIQSERAETKAASLHRCQARN